MGAINTPSRSSHMNHDPDPLDSSVVAEEMFTVNLTQTQIARFWSKTELKESGCIEWTRAKRSHGYGAVRLERKSHGAHRVAFFLKNGSFPAKSEICHRCDNPPCCNPDHLFIGTHLENMRDMFSKNRRTSAKGEKHAAAKLTEHQVVELRARYANNEGSMEALGRDYGITRQSAYLIISRKSWPHIP